ncbi:MAG: glycosyltransferase family 4 protein [Bacteroidetes bacterium]|nr:glycosyltransferase family 4 protein [Bacteroidota bacterium]
MHERPKTLVILSPAFPESTEPSNWVLSQQLFVKTLRTQYPGWRIVLFSFYYPAHTHRYDWHGVDVHCFDGTKKSGIRRILLWRKIWRRLKSICRQNEVAGIFSFWCGECALIGSWFARLNGMRHYCWICGQDARKSNKLVRLIRPKATELVAMSGFLAQKFRQSHGILRAHIIPNAIDSRDFPAGLPDQRDIDIIGVGSLEPQKQYRLFIGVVEVLQKQYPAINAVICGSGPEKESLEQLIRERGLEKNIRLSDRTPHAQVLQLMQRSRILLHPSTYEGFSTVCLEALYAGAQVISICDPMQGPLPHWHVVRSTGEMCVKANEILSKPGDHTRIMLYAMEDSVHAVMRLFGHAFSPTMPAHAPAQSRVHTV